MFIGQECLFGQSGSAQSHLRNNGVGLGDVFLFFGLFADEKTGQRHHRIFGYLRVSEVLSPPAFDLGQLDRSHPHTIGEWNENNTIYRGVGGTAEIAHEALRLTQPGGPLMRWIVPGWLRNSGLSFHGRAERWLPDNRLEIVARGQEFVTDVGDDPAPRDWLSGIIELIRS